MRALASVIACLMAFPAFAQTDRPITKLIVGFAAGGTSSTACRALSVAAGPDYVIENMPGAGGKRAADYVLRQRGSAELLCMSSTATLKVMPDSGLVPIGIFAGYDYVAVVSGHAPGTLAEYMHAAGDAKSDYLRNVATAGGGSVAHLLCAQLFGTHGVDMVHVPHQGSKPAILSVKQGAVSMACVPRPDFVGYEHELRVLSHGDINGWMGLYAPPGTAPEEIARLARTFKRATGEIKSTLEHFGFVSDWQDGEALAKRHARDYRFLLPIADKLGVKP